MNTKDKFKEFVKNNPILLKHVQNGKMTWQKFYEIYDIYGEDKSAWKQYLNDKTAENIATSGTALGLFDFLKNLDLDSIQTGVNSMQRVVSLLQEMSTKNNDTTNNQNYKTRPLYKHFEDWYYHYSLK